MFAAATFPRYSSGGEGSESGVYSVQVGSEQAVDKYVNHLETVGWRREVAAEILAVTQIREVKRRRFVIVMYLSAASFTLSLSTLFVALLGR